MGGRIGAKVKCILCVLQKKYKVAEIIETGKMRRFEEIANNPQVLHNSLFVHRHQEAAFNLFSQIFGFSSLFHFVYVLGAGPESCRKWYAQGFRTLDDLRTKASLTIQQAIGLKYIDVYLLVTSLFIFKEFAQRIPRSEVTQIEKILKNTLSTINSNWVLEVCGSYRWLVVQRFTFHSFSGVAR